MLRWNMDMRLFPGFIAGVCPCLHSMARVPDAIEGKEMDRPEVLVRGGGGGGNRGSPDQAHAPTVGNVVGMQHLQREEKNGRKLRFISNDLFFNRSPVTLNNV